MMHWRNHKFGTMSRELCLKILSNFSLTWFEYVSHRLKYDTRTYVLRRVLYVALCVDQDCWTPHRSWYDLDMWCSQRYEHLGRPIDHLQFRHCDELGFAPIFDNHCGAVKLSVHPNKHKIATIAIRGSMVGTSQVFWLTNRAAILHSSYYCVNSWAPELVTLRSDEPGRRDVRPSGIMEAFILLVKAHASFPD
jgi:hypothetical protein